MNAEKKNILIVDDEVDICDIIEFHISEMTDYRSFKAHNIQKAINILKSENIEVVISDVRMPQGSGMELLDYIKNLPPPRPHVIIISALYEKSKKNLPPNDHKLKKESNDSSDDLVRHITIEMTKDEVQEKGGYTYLPKPINYQELAKTLREILSP